MYTEDQAGDAVPYNEFVSLARDEGLVALEVLVVQAPGEGNGHSAVVQAIARTRDGGFGAVGEASPSSAPAAWRPFLTTLAELRAKARALREMTGLEHAVREELSVPYQIEGEGGEAPSPRMRAATQGTPTAASAAPIVPDEPDEPVALSSIPGLQRGVGGLKSTTRPPPPAPAAPLRPSPHQDEGEDEEGGPDHEDDEDEDGPDDEDHEDGAEAGTPAPRPPAPRPASDPVAPRTVAEAPPADYEQPPEYEPPADYDAVPPDMLDKLKRLAVSIAELEGAELSDAQAILKLDDFFMRAFRHPLGKASRIEGQRVVQKLSSDLSRRRAATSAGDDDDE